MHKGLLVVVLFISVLLLNLSHALFWTSRVAIPAYWRFETSGYVIEESQDFKIHVSPALANPELIGEIEAGMEYYVVLSDYFQHPVPPPMLVVMSNSQLNEYVGGGYSLASAGIYHSGVIILGTNETAGGSIEQTLVHELGHHFVDSIARGKYPTWYGEGVAQLLEAKFLGRLWFDENKHNDYYKYSISELSGDFHGLPDQVSAYRLALDLALAIEEVGGGQAHKEILKEINRGATFSQALEAHTGMSLASIYKRVLGQNK